MKTNDKILTELNDVIQYFISHKDNQPKTEFCDKVDKLINLQADLANGTNTGQDKCHIQRVNRWAYLYDNWSAIMLGFGIAISFSILLNMIENIVVKIALIIHGG